MNMGKAFGFIVAGMLLWQDNQPPVVKILSPKSDALPTGIEQVHYSISVADKEDGDSKFEEINNKEVLMEVRYVKSEAAVQAVVKKGAKDDPPGLTMIRTNNCFNCHNFDGKGIGPSFFEISNRYPFTAANISQVAKRVREGSTGVWGKVSMPTHPELRQEEAEEVVRWMLQNGAKADVRYYVGVDGVFKVSPGVKGAYVLTASYVDHGSASGRRREGQDRVVVWVR